MGFDLYEFQVEDVTKIVRAGKGAIASEMGTGKTHEAIAIDEAWFRKGAGPTLVVAPLRTHGSWVEKYGMQAPQTDVTRIDRKKRDKFVDDIVKGRGDVFLCHYDAVRLLPQLQRIKFNTVILDEAHRISNRKAASTEACKRIFARHKLAMSGTLSGDKPDGLWSPFNWLWPKYYTSYWKFRGHYCEEGMDPTGTYRQLIGTKNVEALMAEIEPWYVRHLKQERCCEHHPDGVMSWLPDKTYDVDYVDLNPQQRRVYDQMRRQMVAWVGEHQDQPLVASVVVAQLVRLSQIALATPELSTKVINKRDGTQVEKTVVGLRAPSEKLDRIKEYCKDNPGKRFVVWSSSKQFVYLAQKALNEAGIGAHALSGDTTDAQADSMISNWQHDDKQVFLGVIAAAREGIDGLQHASSTAIFADRDWNSAFNKQAEDRLHRDGQKDSVQIIDLVARDTVDMGRNQKVEMKWSWVKSILGDK